MITVAFESLHSDVILPFKKTEDIYVERIDYIKPKPIFSFFKFIFDKIFSIVALIILCIPMLIIAFGVKISSPGPVIYKQERLGLNGKKFNILKFRTMYLYAEKDGARWSLNDNDERVTKFGRFLRKTKMDEFPQFINVLKNDMSVIGPRPERECFYIEFEKYIHGFNQRMKVKPGIAGYAQVYGGLYLPPEKKILYDIEYIKNRTLWLDTKIIFKTVYAVIKGDKGE